MSINVSGMCSAVIIAANAGGKCGEEEHDDEYQPNMIRLPDGCDRLRDPLPLTLCARTSRQKVPNASAKIRSSHQGVENQGTERYERDDNLEHESEVGRNAEEVIAR